MADFDKVRLLHCIPDMSDMGRALDKELTEDLVIQTGSLRKNPDVPIKKKKIVIT